MNRLHPFVCCVPLAAAILVAAAGCQRPVAPNPRVTASNVESLKKAFGGGAAEGGPATTAVAAKEPEGWGTLSGKFTLVGAPPGRSVLKIDKDQGVCAPGGKTVFSEEVVVDSAGGIKDVVVYLTTKYPEGNDKWEHSDYAATKTVELELPFDQKNCVFLSHLFVMRNTQTVKIKNSDPVGHNTSISQSAGSKIVPINVTVGAGEITPYAPKGESSIPNPVACTIHPWMSAKLLTRPNPYFAVTKPDGTFEIKNVPAGVELEFAVWQEGAGFIGKANVNGKDEKWAKGRFKLTIDQDTKPLDVKLDASLFAK